MPRFDFTLTDDDSTGGMLLAYEDARVQVHVPLDTGERIGAYLGDPDGWCDADNAGRADAFGEQEVAYISAITVSDGFREQGLGGAALKALLAWLDKKNVAASFLYAMPMGLRGMRQADLKDWYRRHGFHVVSREGYDAVGASNAMMRVNPRAKRKRRRR